MLSFVICIVFIQSYVTLDQRVLLEIIPTVLHKVSQKDRWFKKTGSFHHSGGGTVSSYVVFAVF